MSGILIQQLEKEDWFMLLGTINHKKMVMVQSRCQKWKEPDQISKNVNFEATDI